MAKQANSIPDSSNQRTSAPLNLYSQLYKRRHSQVRKGSCEAMASMKNDLNDKEFQVVLSFGIPWNYHNIGYIGIEQQSIRFGDYRSAHM